VLDANPSLSKIETNAQFAQIISPNETIALITISVSIGELQGMMNCCIPSYSNRTHIEQLKYQVLVFCEKI
jgi:flagellar motor switch protein FliM